MIIVKEVTSRALRKAFVAFPVKLYKNCPYFVPALYSDEMKEFNPKKNPNLEECEYFAFLAYKDGKIVCINNISTHKIFHCISCGREMIAKLGEKRTKHFAHKINVQTCDPNKYLHELTKLVLLQKFQTEDFKIKLNSRPLKIFLFTVIQLFNQ